MSGDIPPYYNDLGLSLCEVQAIIEGGVRERRKAAHTPVVATIDSSGRPSQRVMILRSVDWDLRTLRFHTDSRSAKVKEANDAPVSVIFYDADAKVQIRLAGKGVTLQDALATDAAWEQSTLFARRCYLAVEAPGTMSAKAFSGLPEWIESRKPTDEEIKPARENFAVLLITFDQIEWLYLVNSGHRRARWDWDDSHANWLGSWLVP